MKFGKNRVQFDDFEWYYYRFLKFDTYYYSGGSESALRVAEIANKSIKEIETFYEHQLNKRIIFVIYSNLSDFRQSNIGLETGEDQYNIGGVIKVIDNIAFIYLEDDITKLQAQVRSAITNILLNEMIYGSNIRNKVANNTLLSIPEWYIKGLIAFTSREWDSEMDNLTKNGILSDSFKDFNQLTGDDATIAGYSIWNYISATYGKQVIPNIVYLTKLTKNVESGFLYVLGLSLNSLQQTWTDFYKTQYEAFNMLTDEPEGTNLLKKSRKNVNYYQLCYSSNSKKVAWAENKMGKYWIKIKDLETNKTKTIFRREHKLEQITDYSYPLIKWHPSGQMLGFIIEKKGGIYYMTYNIETKEIKEIEIAALEKVASFDYSNDGLNLVFSAFNYGQSDIFIFNIAANLITNITQDNADDYNPTYINNSKQIIFSSRRKNEEIGKGDDIKTQKYNDVFVYDIASKTIKQITNSSDVNEIQPNFKNNRYTFLADDNGIYNLYSANIDSAISFIDTTTHYRHFLTKTPLTNYKYNILEQNIDKFNQENTSLYRSNNKYGLFYNETLPETNAQLPKTTARLLFENELKRQSLLEEKKQELTDTITYDPAKPLEQPVNINDYSFEKNLVKGESSNNEEFDETGKAKMNRTHKYFTTFYTNYLVTQVDFGFLNNSYQAFTGSAFYFNPGFNIIFKVGTSDLFEDYRITAGARLSANLESNEYILSFENLKKRWNKQLILHRQALLNQNNDNYLIKTHTHEGFYIMRYPFSQVSAMQFTANLRQNRNTFLSIDNSSLYRDKDYEYWASLKAEYIFDNTKEIMTNIRSGSRFKIFGEAFKQIDKKKTDMFVVGCDFRYYQPIHKNIIFAARFASSYSFGSAKLIYYLGGIDNWISLSDKNPMFDNDIRIDPDVNYVYQAVATNMRGFSQNIRNGTNFAVINSELRWPIISYFYRRPINNEFLKNFQVIGFFDIGSAWSGLTPFKGENAYQKDEYDNGSVVVIIENDNYPIVTGYGFGIRSKLFGYFIRADWAWGIDSNTILPSMFYLSLGLDF